MNRPIFAAAVLLGLPAFASAQPLTPLTTASGVGGFGGGARPSTPALTAPNPTLLPSRFGFNNGFGGGFRQPGFPVGGIWGGFGYGYPYGYSYPVPVPVPVDVPVQIGPPEPPPITLSNEFPAVLVLEFPAPAEVWVNGDKGSGDPITEWTLTSPVLKAGGEFTFDVKARWKSGGKTFEYTRSVTVAGGKRSRALVVTGTEVKE